MEEPCRPQSMGSLRVRYDWVTSLSLFTFMHWRRKWQPTPVFLPGESQGWRSLVGFVYGVAQSWTRLKSLSGSSSSFSRHGKMQESGFLISFLSHPSQLSGPSIIVFRIPSYSELTVGSGCNLMATRCQVFFSLSALRTQELTSEG